MNYIGLYIMSLWLSLMCRTYVSAALLQFSPYIESHESSERDNPQHIGKVA